MHDIFNNYVDTLYMHCKQYVEHKPRFMIGRQLGDHRPTASVCRRFFDKMSSADRLAIVGRLTPDDRATFGRYHDEKIFKKSADQRVKIGGSVNETFNLGADVARFSQFWLTDRRFR